jgi:hypothetical protein
LPTDSSLPVARVLAATEELRWQAGPEFHQALIEGIYTEAARIADVPSSAPGTRRCEIGTDGWIGC